MRRKGVKSTTGKRKNQKEQSKKKKDMKKIRTKLTSLWLEGSRFGFFPAGLKHGRQQQHLRRNDFIREGREDEDDEAEGDDDADEGDDGDAPDEGEVGDGWLPAAESSVRLSSMSSSSVRSSSDSAMSVARSCGVTWSGTNCTGSESCESGSFGSRTWVTSDSAILVSGLSI